MPRPIWKGAISFGLVTVPVGLYSAVQREDLAFRLLHRKDGARIDYRRFCEEETGADFAKAKVEATQTIDITDFVPAGDIDWIYFESTYYLAPTKAGAKGYASLREALRESGRVGVGTIVMRQRQHLAAVRPMGDDVLVLLTMRFKHEIRPISALDMPRARKVDPREKKLALELVDTLAGSFQPEKYRDTYRDVLMGIIEQKRRGQKVTAPAPSKRPQKVVSLVKALERSLAEPRHAARDRRAPRRAA